MASPKPLSDQLGYCRLAYRLNQTLQSINQSLFVNAITSKQQKSVGLYDTCGSWTFSQRQNSMVNKMLSYRKETAPQGALQFSP